MHRTIRVSSGTACVLGLDTARLDALPTTAYLLVGDRCSADCSFCAQARGSRASAGALSRVQWPSYQEDEVVSSVRGAYRAGRIVRACLQVTVSRGYLERAKAIVTQLRDIPLCASVVADLDEVGELLDAGLEIVGLSLDGASAEVYRRVKGNDLYRALALLEGAAKRFPGRIATHVIVGLGETEEDLARLVQRLSDVGVIVALFAFTPVPGTALEKLSPPPLSAYRRVQIARHLVTRGLTVADRFTFSSEGHILSYGLGEGDLWAALKDGVAFQTSGCPGCNRPYYNERPGGPLYNYPRPLTLEELRVAMAEAGLTLTAE